jgi:hypothetical protein
LIVRGGVSLVLQPAMSLRRLASSVSIRLAASGQRHAPGTEVVVHLPAEACRLVRP